MADITSQIELSIELDNEDDEQALKHLLSSLPLEAVVVQTLSQAGIERPDRCRASHYQRCHNSVSEQTLSKSR